MSLKRSAYKDFSQSKYFPRSRSQISMTNPYGEAKSEFKLSRNTSFDNKAFLT